MPLLLPGAVEDEGGGADNDALRLQFEAAQRLSPEEKKILMVVIEGILLKHHASLGDQRLARTG